MTLNKTGVTVDAYLKSRPGMRTAEKSFLCRFDTMRAAWLSAEIRPIFMLQLLALDPDFGCVGLLSAFSRWAADESASPALNAEAAHSYAYIGMAAANFISDIRKLSTATAKTVSISCAAARAVKSKHGAMLDYEAIDKAASQAQREKLRQLFPTKFMEA